MIKVLSSNFTTFVKILFPIFRMQKSIQTCGSTATLSLAVLHSLLLHPIGYPKYDQPTYISIIFIVSKDGISIPFSTNLRIHGHLVPRRAALALAAAAQRLDHRRHRRAWTEGRRLWVCERRVYEMVSEEGGLVRTECVGSEIAHPVNGSCIYSTYSTISVSISVSDYP